MTPRVLPALAAFFLLAICSCAHQAPTSTAILPPVTNITASLAYPPTIKPLTNVPFTLSLKDSQTGKPVDGAKTTLSLAMPSMSMPLNIFRLSETQPGAYTGTGVFTMAGSWRVIAVVLLPDGREWSKTSAVKVG